MTKKEFKAALVRGLGRCIPAVKKDPEKYRDLVMWACGQELGFDIQSEGSRAWYIHQLVHCYEDIEPFVRTAASALQRSCSRGGWKVYCLCELLSFFAAEGNELAREALEQKYQELYHTLMARKQPQYGIFPERDDFVFLCLNIATDEASFLKIAADIGKLYRNHSFYDGFDFDQLYDVVGRRFLAVLKREAKVSEDIARYLEKQLEREREWKKRVQNRVVSERKGVVLSLWLARKADKETIRQYAQTYLQERDPERRAEALGAFCCCPYPEDPFPILQDAESEHETLRETAWRTLGNIRHPKVRAFAFLHLGEEKTRVIPILAKNYLPEDAEMLAQMITSIPIYRAESTGWHSAQMDILGMEEDNLKAPPALLRYIYESTLCSCCRERVIQQMGKRRLLTTDMLQECMYDSSEEIRVYAAKCLKRRKKI